MKIPDKWNMRTAGYALLFLLALLAVLKLILTPPIEQDPAYHNFSDKTTLLTIPNFWNVVSNLPFLIVGLLGFFKIRMLLEDKRQYLIFFAGTALVSFGSAYYHLSPNNSTLVWDRLPMTIGFMALFSILISEFIHLKRGHQLLVPLLILGILSVVYWWLYDDLRFYLLIQFYPVLSIPIILTFFKSSYNLTIGYWLLLFAYVIAKVMEIYDYEIHNYLGVISGHTLKHLFAELGIFILLYTYMKREKRPDLSGNIAAS
jgi:hypothetical protein